MSDVERILRRHADIDQDALPGLVRGADGELVFREHTKRVGSVTVRCSGSGVAP